MTKGLLSDARRQLICPTDRDHAESRSLGFVNAEHEILAFIASGWFYDLMDAFLTCCSDRPRQWSPYDIGQQILDQAFQGQLTMATQEELWLANIPLTREGQKPRDGRHYEYSFVKTGGHKHVLSALKAYDEIITWEVLEYGHRMDVPQGKELDFGEEITKLGIPRSA